MKINSQIHLFNLLQQKPRKDPPDISHKINHILFLDDYDNNDNNNVDKDGKNTNINQIISDNNNRKNNKNDNNISNQDTKDALENHPLNGLESIIPIGMILSLNFQCIFFLFCFLML